ncbi:MAG: nuclease-related domain-containing protein [Actinomycetota bacterium]
MVLRAPAQSLHERLRRMSSAAALLIAEAGLLALVGAWWWPLSVLALLSVVVLGRATLEGGRLDVVQLRSGIRGEERVAQVLAPLEAEGYRVLHDLDIGRGNADHVVVGPSGVYVIETKDRGGRFHPSRGRLMLNDARADDVVGQVTAVAIVIRRRLERAGVDVWVQAVIASTRAKVYRSPLRVGHVTAAQAEHLPGLIRGRRQVFDDAEVARATEAVLRP